MQKDRDGWVSLAGRLARPVLESLARGRLKAELPREGDPERVAYAPLEAFARLLLGLAPWLELKGDLDEAEARLKARCLDLSLAGLERAVAPQSPDRMNFDQGRQPLVDAALLGAALLRAPTALLEALPKGPRGDLIAALESTRAIEPFWNNWLLFPALIEVVLGRLGAPWREAPVETALRLHETWYRGDGVYGDGPDLACDYYNSIMIHPLLLDLVEGADPLTRRWRPLHAGLKERALRHAAVLERLISPEGSYPPLGRSLCYRAGVLHHLAYMALRRELPEPLRPAGVRCALGAVLRRQMEAPGTFDAGGWLTLGLAGHQPGLAESYVGSGSVYFAAAVLPPLGLAPGDPFWSDPDEDWTSRALWAGGPGRPDRKLEGAPH